MKTRSAEEIWEIALGELQIQVNPTNYETWLKNTIGLSYQSGFFTVGTPTIFIAEWLEKRLQSLIKKTLVSIMGHDLEVQFHVDETVPTPVSHRRPATKAKPVRGEQLALRFNPKYTFDNFITGNSNRLAYAAALGVAENPGQTYNPLFIYGNTSLGKTHLLHAIGHVALTGGLRILYVNAEQFTNDFVTSLRERKTEEFHQKYRDVDILLVDDIDFIAGKEQTQQSFFHTFEDLHNANCQIAVTSDRAPRNLPTIQERLCARFECGLITPIHSPSMDTRVAILQAKAEQLSTTVPTDVLQLIARQGSQNIRELEGALNRVIAQSRLTGAKMAPELVAEALQHRAADFNRDHFITPKFIIGIVANYFCLSPQALQSKARDRKTVYARHIAIYLIHQKIPRPLTEIGREFSNRDHSTVLHSYNKIASGILSDPKLREQIMEIEASLVE